MKVWICSALLGLLGCTALAQPKHYASSNCDGGPTRSEQVKILFGHLSILLQGDAEDEDIDLRSRIMRRLSVPERQYKPVCDEDGATFIAGCRFRACDEKAAVIFRPDGSVALAALLTMTDNGKNDGDVFELEVHILSGQLEQRYVDAVETWASDKGEIARSEIFRADEKTEDPS